MDTGQTTQDHVSRYKHTFYTRIILLIYLHEYIEFFKFQKGIAKIQYNTVNENAMPFHFYIQCMQVKQLKTMFPGSSMPSGIMYITVFTSIAGVFEI